MPVFALLIPGLALGSAACAGDPHPLSSKPYDASEQIVFNGDGDQKVNPDKPLEITARKGGRITDVTATDAAGRHVRGALTHDGTRWQSTTPLAAGAHYTVRVSTENGDGDPGLRSIGFQTAGADQLLRVAFGPDSGTYGVGQPITAELSRPIKSHKDRATVERALRVESHPRVTGLWHWVDNKTLHYRPREYWPAGARIEVHSGLQGVRVGKMRGGAAKPLKLRIGARVEAVTDASRHTMTVKRNGKVLRTIPVTTGKPGFDTRNGIKTILGKEAFVQMRSQSVGIAAGSAESYDLGVHWATRVTWSGEYLHAAPWSVGSQGSANTSHGCTGMSTENAKWFFDHVRVGDIVVVKGSGGEKMTPFDNGFGDWNLSWAKWRAGSATQSSGAGGAGAAQSSRLRPGV